MSVSLYYQQAMRREGFSPDDAQRAVVLILDDIYHALANSSRANGFFAQWFGRKAESVEGLYLWGGVGRGKTFLMDAFYDVLPIKEKRRLHFHRFMILVHERLHGIRKNSSALKEVAWEYARKYRVLCLDEMHITDEGDAVIMEGLLVNMLSHGMILITTSNRAPDDLTDDPYIGRLFSRAAHALQNNLRIVNMDDGIDYRLRYIEKAEVWYSPLDDESLDALENAFYEFGGSGLIESDHIVINQRSIPVVKWSDGIAWFDFNVICGPPRARIDYIEIAHFFHTVIMQNVPELNDDNSDCARRLNLLIDELYDHNVKLIVSSSQMIESLYQGTRLTFEFQRTRSRLQEMQSHEYLVREHDS